MSASFRLALRAYAALWTVTLAGAVAGRLVQGAPNARILRRTEGLLFVDVLVTNARLIGAVALAAVVVAAVPAWRSVGDVVVTGLLGVNAIAVGAGVGAAGMHAAAWLAHLPVEWAALAAAGTLYLHARGGRITGRTAATWGCGALGLLVVAAGVEAWAPPLG